MKKSVSILFMFLLAVSFIQLSIVMAESGPGSNGTSDSESDDSGNDDNSEDEMESESETQLEIEGDEVKFEQETKINGVETKIKREMKDGVLREEIKQRIRNASGEYEMELKQEFRDGMEAQREKMIYEFKAKLREHNGTLEIEQKMIKINELNEERKEIIAGKINARTGLNLTAEDVDNRTMLRAYLSNGAFADIKVLPDVAAARAVERMKINCEERNCSVELKEVARGNETRAVYEIKAEKEARMLFIFKTKMKVDAEVDAETGELLQARKPWWAFLANEKDDSQYEVESEVEVESNETEDSNITETMPALDENVTDTITENESELAAV